MSGGLWGEGRKVRVRNKKDDLIFHPSQIREDFDWMLDKVFGKAKKCMNTEIWEKKLVQLPPISSICLLYLAHAG